MSWEWPTLALIGALAVIGSMVSLLLVPDLRTRLVRRSRLEDVPTRPFTPSRLVSNRISTESWPDAREDALAIRATSWVRTKVSQYGPESSLDPDQLLASVESGGSAICSGMAVLTRHALGAAGLATRSVVMRRNMLDPFDSHTSVEVRVDHRWILIDPTFGVVPTDERGERLSASEAQELLLGGRPVAWASVGSSSYPVSIATYYIDFRFLFNNVFVADYAGSWVVRHTPPLRYFWGPRLYFEDRGPNDSTEHLRTIARAQFVAQVLAPITGAGIFIVACAAGLGLA